MKLYPFKKFRFSLRKLVLFCLIVIIASCSLTIDSVVQPSSIQGSGTLPVTLNVTITTNQAQTSKFMVAVLVPKIWKVGQSATTKITFTSSITSGDQPMSIIPAGTAAPQGGGLDWPTLLATKIGNGGNLINDYEWVAFYSDAAYTVAGNATITAQVKIGMKVSEDNLAFKLGYCCANSTDGLSGSDRYGSYFTSCFRVNGTGDLIDFCNPQLSTIEPRNSLDNDVITINFDAAVSQNALSNATNVYLCATGITTANQRIDVCTQTAQTKMDYLGVGRFRKDIWPRQLFSLTASQTLKSIEYFFTDASGNNKIGYGGGTAPFPYTFKCQ